MKISIYSGVALAQTGIILSNRKLVLDDIQLLKSKVIYERALSIRDIDPSCVLKKTGRGDGWKVHSPTWWFSSNYVSWDEPSDDIEWMNLFDDLPDARELIQVNSDNSGWLTLDGYFKWQQPTPPEADKFDLDRRDIWYMVKSYFVKEADIDDLYAWALEQNYMGRWMPETREIYNDVFLGEFFWSPAYGHHCNPRMRSVGWQGGESDDRIPKPIRATIDGYAKEESGHDCSIDEAIKISLPSQFIVENMNLKWRGEEGYYYNQNEKLIAFDPSVQEDGPSIVLINQEAFLSFLKENGLSIFWTILGEKRIIGGGYNHNDWKGRLEISGAYRMNNGYLEGKVTPYFHSLQDRN